MIKPKTIENIAQLCKTSTLVLLVFIALLLFYSNERKIITKTEVPATTEEIIPTEKFEDFHLLIPSLGISAPIIEDVDGQNKNNYFEALQQGVAHYKNTAKPGENGNVFIFGHSSYYWWDSGRYKNVFENLPDIKEGDEVIVWRNEKKYSYKVTTTQIVDPSNVSVLKQTQNEQVTLMTCVPPGTALKRLIVIAKPKT